MRSKKKLLKSAKLYLILDAEVNNYDQLFEILKQTAGWGVDIIQLRDKRGSAQDVLKFSKRAVKFLKGRTPFIMNDQVDLAVASQANGVHLGQTDLPLKQARKIMGPKGIIGVSCQTLKQALAAEREGADYIGFGSVFKTLTKPQRKPMNLKLLKQVTKKVKVPVYAIGGISLNNIPSLNELGVRRVAVCRAICKAKDVREAARDFKSLLEKVN